MDDKSLKIVLDHMDSTGRKRFLRQLARGYPPRPLPPRNGASISPWTTLDPTQKLPGGGGG